MGLRLAEGIDPKRYAALSGRSLDPARIAILRDEAPSPSTPMAGCADAVGISGAGCGGGGSGGVILLNYRVPSQTERRL